MRLSTHGEREKTLINHIADVSKTIRIMKRLVVLIIVLIGLISLIGCKTTHEVERVVVRDTITSVHRDTVRLENIRYIGRDSIIRDTIVIVKDTAGKIIYKEIIRDRVLRLNRGDTARFYSSTQDSTLSHKNALTEQKTEVIKKDSRGWGAFAILLAVMIVFAALEIYRRAKK